ncbi:basic salivary proline-rich protein 1-like [Serinus canaria]|uniref:basic salivary proline-rich protein 1-like n=1 Tax=Serinus canaria TaxID=9135 RepID=UPI0021CCADFC|nr:basic salivary proline-rich protein 1-like [Serinus canaria]
MTACEGRKGGAGKGRQHRMVPGAVTVCRAPPHITRAAPETKPRQRPPGWSTARPPERPGARRRKLQNGPARAQPRQGRGGSPREPLPQGTARHRNRAEARDAGPEAAAQNGSSRPALQLTFTLGPAVAPPRPGQSAPAAPPPPARGANSRPRGARGARADPRDGAAVGAPRAPRPLCPPGRERSARRHRGAGEQQQQQHRERAPPPRTHSWERAPPPGTHSLERALPRCAPREPPLEPGLGSVGPDSFPDGSQSPGSQRGALSAGPWPCQRCPCGLSGNAALQSRSGSSEDASPPLPELPCSLP